MRSRSYILTLFTLTNFLWCVQSSTAQTYSFTGDCDNHTNNCCEYSAGSFRYYDNWGRDSQTCASFGGSSKHLIIPPEHTVIHDKLNYNNIGSFINRGSITLEAGISATDYILNEGVLIGAGGTLSSDNISLASGSTVLVDSAIRFADSMVSNNASIFNPRLFFVQEESIFSNNGSFQLTDNSGTGTLYIHDGSQFINTNSGLLKSSSGTAIVRFGSSGLNMFANLGSILVEADTMRFNISANQGLLNLGGDVHIEEGATFLLSSLGAEDNPTSDAFEGVISGVNVSGAGRFSFIGGNYKIESLLELSKATFSGAVLSLSADIVTNSDTFFDNTTFYTEGSNSLTIEESATLEFDSISNSHWYGDFSLVNNGTARFDSIQSILTVSSVNGNYPTFVNNGTVEDFDMLASTSDPYPAELPPFKIYNTGSWIDTGYSSSNRDSAATHYINEGYFSVDYSEFFIGRLDNYQLTRVYSTNNSEDLKATSIDLHPGSRLELISGYLTGSYFFNIHEDALLLGRGTLYSQDSIQHSGTLNPGTEDFVIHGVNGEFVSAGTINTRAPLFINNAGSLVFDIYEESADQIRALSRGSLIFNGGTLKAQFAEEVIGSTERLIPLITGPVKGVPEFDLPDISGTGNVYGYRQGDAGLDLFILAEPTGIYFKPAQPIAVLQGSSTPHRVYFSNTSFDEEISPIPSDITWSSSDETIASFNGSKLVAHNPGTVTVTADFGGGITATRDVTVYEKGYDTEQRNLISAGSEGVSANDLSEDVSASFNGRMVAFSSLARNLTDEVLPVDEPRHIYLQDRLFKTRKLLTLGVDEALANGDSFYPSVSSNGTFVAFSSLASNLVEGDTNGEADIFLWDNSQSILKRISVSSTGAQNDGACLSKTGISYDGRFIAFTCQSSNLDGGTASTEQVYIHDQQLGTTTLVSKNTASGYSNSVNPTNNVSLSLSGEFVVFSSDASDLVVGDTNGDPDIFLYQVSTGFTERVSLKADGTEHISGVDLSAAYASVSNDGRYVVFESASGMVSGDNSQTDIYLRDRLLESTVRITETASGGTLDSHSYRPYINPAGTEVTFYSRASDIHPLSPTDTTRQVYSYNLGTGEFTLISTNEFFVAASADSSRAALPIVTTDGCEVFFHSDASDISEGDINGVRDVYSYLQLARQSLNEHILSESYGCTTAERWSPIPRIAGDYDGNGVVDREDYQAWRSSYGAVVSPQGAGADGNGDGRVDAADYTIWRNNLGASLALPDPDVIAVSEQISAAAPIGDIGDGAVGVGDTEQPQSSYSEIHIPDVVAPLLSSEKNEQASFLCKQYKRKRTYARCVRRACEAKYESSKRRRKRCVRKRFRNFRKRNAAESL